MLNRGGGFGEGGEWFARSVVVPDVFQTASERQTSSMRSVEDLSAAGDMQHE